MDDRQEYETEIGHIIQSPAKPGRERRREILDLADGLGLSKDTVGQKLYTTKVIREAAEDLGFPGGQALAAWRLASGFAHGRMWPDLMASEVSGAAPITGGAWVGVVISDTHIDKVAMWCDRFLERTLDLYDKRSQKH
jgi:hypothetical protein